MNTRGVGMEKSLRSFPVIVVKKTTGLI